MAAQLPQPARPLALRLLTAGLVGAFRGVLVVLFAHDMLSALVVLVAIAIGAAVASASYLATRRRTGANTGVFMAPSSLIVGTGCLAVITYVAWRSLTTSALVCAVALALDLLFVYVGWPALQRLMAARPQS